jgi:hypothetical protein
MSLGEVFSKVLKSGFNPGHSRSGDTCSWIRDCLEFQRLEEILDGAGKKNPSKPEASKRQSPENLEKYSLEFRRFRRFVMVCGEVP